MIELFGKVNAGYLKTKKLFYDLKTNQDWLDREDQIRKVYVSQPERSSCVVCNFKLLALKLQIRGVDYRVCANCSHLNGAHQDTKEFVEFLYNRPSGDGAFVYFDNDMALAISRINEIYLPKVDFMMNQLKNLNAVPEELSYVDVGAGAGHFVQALRKRNLKKSSGIEMSKEMVDHANSFFSENFLSVGSAETLNDRVSEIDADVLTMIFSLEHVIDMRGFLAAVKRNRKIRYFYFAVPMFNPSIVLEALFPDLMPRSIGFGHTHLFTEKSISLMCQEFGFRQEAAWWFGANGFDLHRLVWMSLAAKKETQSLLDHWDGMMEALVDPIQLSFDKCKMSSEVHILASVMHE